MNYYIVRIGKLSSKSKVWCYQPVEIYVSSDKPLFEVEDYYKQKYSGFDIDVKEISFESLKVETKKEEKETKERVGELSREVKRETLEYPYLLDQSDSDRFREKYNEMKDLKKELQAKVKKDILERNPFFEGVIFCSDFYPYDSRKFAIKFKGFYKFAFEEYLDKIDDTKKEEIK